MAATTKLKIKAFSDKKFSSSVGELSVLMNPASLERTYCIQYSDSQPMGQYATTKKFDKLGGDKVSFDILFDGTGVIDDSKTLSKKTAAEQIEEFNKIVLKYDGHIHEPYFLELFWGKTFESEALKAKTFKCRLESVSFSYTMFDPNGHPVRAKAKATFVHYMDHDTAASKQTKSSPDLSHLRSVKQGQTLPMMCNEIYGDSSMYLEIARINNLINFRNLQPGTNLLFPPIKK